MTIKEVSEKFGITPDTLRYYEKIGIILPVNRNSGIRNYGEKEIANIEFAVCMRNAGLSIESLTNYIALMSQGEESANKRRQILIDQREILRAKVKDINNAIDKLDYKIDVYYDEILKREKEMIRR